MSMGFLTGDGGHAMWRVLLAMVLLPCLAAGQQNTLKVELDSQPDRPTVVGTFQRQGVLYVSLSDLVDITKASTYENASAGKLEIKFPEYRVKITRGNPFLVVTTPGAPAVRRQSVLQLSRDILYAANSYFLPLDAEPSPLSLILNMPVSYDRRAGVLRVGKPGLAPGSGFDIPAVRLEEKANGMLIRIVSTRHIEDIESWLRQDNWLYVTIPDARANLDAINGVPPSGLIRKIVAIQTPTAVQLTFRLSGKIAATEVVRDEGSNDLLLSVRAEGSEQLLLPEKKEPTAAVAAPPPPKPPVSEQRMDAAEPNLETTRKKWEMDVIVLDAGHGGKDWGAIGVTGAREKDVALGVTLKLGRLIDKNLAGVKVVYTRKDDRFVELDRRGQIANASGGKLFVSIHANSLKRKPSPTRGFEVYLLRPGRTAEAIAIAEQENSVIQYEEGYEERYKHLTDENFILQTMAQSAYMRSSELFADLAQQELQRLTGIPNHGVKQAGFYVLVGASMPNVLVETAYLSNQADERFLKSQSGQQKCAEALFRAVKRYKGEYEKLLREGTDVGSSR